MGRDRAEVLAVARRYQNRPVIDRAFGQARSLIERELRDSGKRYTPYQRKARLRAVR